MNCFSFSFSFQLTINLKNRPPPPPPPPHPPSPRPRFITHSLEHDLIWIIRCMKKENNIQIVKVQSQGRVLLSFFLIFCLFQPSVWKNFVLSFTGTTVSGNIFTKNSSSIKYTLSIFRRQPWFLIVQSYNWF